MASTLRGIESEHSRDRYEAWRQQMGQRRKEKVDAVAADLEQIEREQKNEGPGPHWDPSTVFPAGGPVVQIPAEDMTQSELRFLFSLPEGYSKQELTSAYRRLLREHHPDRWVAAAPEERDEHARYLQRVREAHDILQQS